MSAGRATKAGAAYAALAATVMYLGASAAPAMADHPLQPDLVTLELTESDLQIVQRGDKTHLLLENDVGNQGPGPLEIFGEVAETGCGATPSGPDRFAAFQRSFLDADESFDFDPAVDTDFVEDQIGCLRYHDKPGHDHWHMLNFGRYSLESEEDGTEVNGRKAGFCLLDLIQLPGPSLPKYYGGSSGNLDCATGQPNQPPEVMGISPGWADRYGMGTAGQFVDVTGLTPGRYCLISRADPEGQITETVENNNGDALRVRINSDRLRVKGLTGPCQLPR